MAKGGTLVKASHEYIEITTGHSAGKGDCLPPGSPYRIGDLRDKADYMIGSQDMDFHLCPRMAGIAVESDRIDRRRGHTGG
jgi:hypothetical protein